MATTAETELKETLVRTTSPMEGVEKLIEECPRDIGSCQPCRRKTACRRHWDIFANKHTYSCSLSELKRFKTEQEALRIEGRLSAIAAEPLP
jgi:hypothetical protein